MTIYLPMKLLLVLSPLACAVKHGSQVQNAEASDAVGSSQLPGMDSLVEDMTHVAQGIGSEAMQMRVQIEGLQAQNAKKLKVQNAAYDQRLKEQEEGNLRLQRKNAASASKLVSVYKENQAMMKQLAFLKHSNKVRAEELSALKKQLQRGAREAAGGGGLDMPKMESAVEDTEGSPTSVETSSSPLETSEELLPASSGLSFLEMEMEAAPKGVDIAEVPAVSNLQNVDPAVEALSLQNVDPAVEALLPPESEQAESEEVLPAEETPMQAPVVSTALEAVAGNAQAQSIVRSMSQGFAKLDGMSRRVEQRMKQIFQQAYKAGKRRGDAMIQQSKVLELKFHSLERGRKNIKKAVDRERKLTRTLETRIQDLGSFLGSLQRVVTSPLNNVPQALKAAQAWHMSPASPA